MRNFQTPGRSGVFASNGMCATSHPLAAQVAIETLKAGGNSMDAAIAGAVLLGICEPHMTGIGGDCFALFSPAGSDEVLGYNGSGWAANAADPDALRADGLEKIEWSNVHSVTVPGAIDAFCSLSADWGRLGLDRVLAPAIHYAEAGVPVAPRVAADWAKAVARLNPTAQGFYSNAGSAPQLGQLFRAPKQAEVLRRVAAQGRVAFYEGEIAEDMQASLANLGSFLSLQDFADLRTFATEPISERYPKFDLFEHPPNGQGATAILMMNILRHFDMEALSPDSTMRVHLEAEASKLAYNARNQLIADPFLDVGAEMLSEGLAAELAKQIDPKRVLPPFPRPKENPHKDTVLITVVDRDGMAVSLIYSIFGSFGSGIASEKFGILMQNRGSGFNLTKGHPNEFGPRKRPMHTIIPGMLKQEGRVTMSFGVMGGQFQPAGHTRLLMNHFTYGMDLQSAIDYPRCFADEGVLKLEGGVPNHVAQELADLGHDVLRLDMPLGGAQAIYMHESGVLEGASDPRKDGIALGY